MLADDVIYLASPYTDPDPYRMERRFRAVSMAAARLVREGHIVYCAISHTHPIALHGLPADWAFWGRLDAPFLAMCAEVWVLKLPGWHESRGVQAECSLAVAQCKAIHYLKPTAAELAVERGA